MGFNLYPDLNIFINIDSKTSIKRSLKVKKLENRFEKKSRNFHKIVQVAFESISKKKRLLNLMEMKVKEIYTKKSSII